MSKGRYDSSAARLGFVAEYIDKASVMLRALQRIEQGDMDAADELLRLARDLSYEGPVIQFRLDDLFDYPSRTAGHDV